MLCPKCSGRVGSFDVANGIHCACGQVVVPGIAISKKRIDECKTNSSARRTVDSRSANQLECAHATDLIGEESHQEDTDHMHAVGTSDGAQEVWRAPFYFTGRTEDRRGDAFGHRRHGMDSKHFPVQEDGDVLEDAKTDGHCCAAVHTQCVVPELGVWQIPGYFPEVNEQHFKNLLNAHENSSRGGGDTTLEVPGRNCKTVCRRRKRKVWPNNAALHNVNRGRSLADDWETGHCYVPSSPVSVVPLTFTQSVCMV